MKIFLHRPMKKVLSSLRVRHLSLSQDKATNIEIGGAKYPEIEKTYDHTAKYRSLGTVEEKLFALNLPKYYGYHTLFIRETEYPYAFLPFAKYVTNTKHHLVDKELLYSLLSNKVDREECKAAVESLRKPLQEAIMFELKGRRWQREGVKEGGREEADLIAADIVKQVHSTIMSALSHLRPSLLSSMTNFDERVEAWWSVGGFPSTKENSDSCQETSTSDESQSYYFQHFSLSSLSVRMEEMLGPVNTQPLDDRGKSQQESDTPLDSGNFSWDPEHTYSLPSGRRFGTDIPGFWCGDENENKLLSYHLCNYLRYRPAEWEDFMEALHCQAVLSGFSHLHAMASYHGFCSIEDVTYPLVSQSIITDGQYFSQHVYQLNTSLIDAGPKKSHQLNPRHNICVSLPHQPLYTDIDNLQFKDWNDEVVELLVMMYLHKGVAAKEMSSRKLKPYLDNGGRHHLKDLPDEDVERRVWLHNQFRHMYSNRPRHRLPYEIYDWERIYQIKFDMRPLEARFRPFQLDENPTEDRKYHEHMPPYIPKASRPKGRHWTGWRAKFAKTFYPELESGDK